MRTILNLASALLDKVVNKTTGRTISLLTVFSFSILSLFAQERAGTTISGHKLIPIELLSEVETVRAKGFDIDRFPLFRYYLNDSAIIKLKIGDPIPDTLWSTPMFALHRTDTIHTIRLDQYRDRDLIILDNWAHWCAPCVASMIKWEKLTKKYPDKIALVGVNLDYPYATLPFLKNRGWESVSVYGLDARILNRSFFRSIMASRLVWIYKGKLYAITGTKSYEIADVLRLLEGENVQLKNAADETY